MQPTVYVYLKFLQVLYQFNFSELQQIIAFAYYAAHHSPYCFFVSTHGT